MPKKIDSNITLWYNDTIGLHPKHKAPDTGGFFYAPKEADMIECKEIRCKNNKDHICNHSDTDLFFRDKSRGYCRSCEFSLGKQQPCRECRQGIDQYCRLHGRELSDREWFKYSGCDDWK